MVELSGIIALSLYKLATLLVGLSITNMGFRLFMADKTRPAGELEAKFDKYALSLKGGAPGVFFSLFGASIILATIVKGLGMEYKNNSLPLPQRQANPEIRILPSSPPE